MLKTIHLQNFKSHRDTTLEFDDSRLYAIVGQNSAGKTSILQGIHAITCANIHMHGYKFSPDFLITSGEKEMCVKASGIHEKIVWEASCTWGNDPFTGDANVPENWHRVFRWRTGEEDEQQSKSMSRKQFPFSHELEHAIYLKLNANQLAEPGYSIATYPKIGDGDGLAPVLDYILSESLETFLEIQTMLKAIVPSVNGIRVGRKKVKIKNPHSQSYNKLGEPEMMEVMGNEIIFDMNGGQIPAHAVSEGTILTLGLLATIMNPSRPNIVLLDDLDRGLHPKAQIELVQLLKKIIEANPELQIIFTTHSPYILDELELSQVHVLHMDENGQTVEKRLDEHTDSTWSKGGLTTGEFWDAEGEEWVLEESEQGVKIDG